MYVSCALETATRASLFLWFPSFSLAHIFLSLLFATEIRKQTLLKLHCKVDGVGVVPGCATNVEKRLSNHLIRWYAVCTKRYSYCLCSATSQQVLKWNILHHSLHGQNWKSTIVRRRHWISFSFLIKKMSDVCSRILCVISALLFNENE